jgi:exodeoxyribonuclease VII large subunit
VYPVLVQGIGAAPDIAEAIRQVNLLFPETDTIIVGRGGGSIEELWAFNEEIVARSIFESKIPIISAVGHEIDFTISDFVADKRAETPTAAAQMAVPDVHILKEYVSQLRSKLQTQLANVIRYKELELRHYNVDTMGLNLERRMNLHRSNIDNQYKEMFTTMSSLIYNRTLKVASLLSELEALNPRSVMKRGYSAILGDDGRLKNSINDFKMQDKLTAVLSDGRVDCIVKEIRRED